MLEIDQNHTGAGFNMSGPSLSAYVERARKGHRLNKIFDIFGSLALAISASPAKLGFAVIATCSETIRWHRRF